MEFIVRSLKLSCINSPNWVTLLPGVNSLITVNVLMTYFLEIFLFRRIKMKIKNEWDDLALSRSERSSDYEILILTEIL